MEIRLEIVADSVDEYHEALRRLLAGTATVAPAEVKDNVVAVPAKGRPRKAVDNTAKSEPEPEEKIAHDDQRSNRVDVGPEDQTADTPQDEVDELAGQIEDTKPEPPKVVLTNNNVKALAIRYINDAVTGDAAKDPSIQDGRRKLFGEIIDSTGVTDRKFSSIPDNKLEDVVAYITKQRAEKKLKPDEVRD